MKCPYCKNNLNDINFPMIEHKFATSRDYIPDGTDMFYEHYENGDINQLKIEYIKYSKEDDKETEIKYPEYEFGFSCGHCGGFITTDENKAIEILSDTSDEVYEVDPEEKKEMVDRLLTLIRTYNLEDEIFDPVIKRNSWIEKSLKSVDDD